MKKILTILTIICFAAPMAVAAYYSEPGRDVSDLNTFEVREDVLREIQAAERNTPRQQTSNPNQKVNAKTQKAVKSSTTTKKEIKKGGKVPNPNAQKGEYHYGRPNYGYRVNY